MHRVIKNFPQRLKIKNQFLFPQTLFASSLLRPVLVCRLPPQACPDMAAPSTGLS